MTASAATPDLERLNPFVGIWETEGEVKAGPTGKPVKFQASDTYEWLPGGHFLLHRFDADMPDGRVQGIEVLGYSREDGCFSQHSFDNSGKVSVMQARVEKDTWTFVGEGVRFTGSFQDNGKVFAGLWELRSEEDAAWRPWMDVRLTKVG